MPAQIFAEFCNGGCAPTATIKADGVSGFYSVRVSGLNQSFRISAQCTGYDSWSITGSSGSLFNETTKFNGIQTIDIPTEWDINPHSGVYTYSITCKKLGAADATASVTVDYRRVFRLYVSQKEGLGTGKISCPGSGAECFSAGHCSVSEINLPEDAKFNCQALPDAGSRFAGWTACPGTSNNAYCSIVMNANQSVYARFEKASVP